MDLSRYWAVVRDHWIFFVGGLVITAMLASVFALNQPDVYRSSATFVVRPRVVEGSEVVRAIDTLNRSVEIGSTYAFIARSELIKDLARDTLDDDDVGAVTIGADLVPGTNVVEIVATGLDPEDTAAMAEAVGLETVAYVANLQDAFELVPLDSADVPNNPFSPNRALTIGFGVIFGLGVGLLVAMAAQLAKEWRQRPTRDDVTDTYTGVYSEEYFNAKFRQEVLRAKRRRRSFSLGLMKFAADHRTHQSVPSQPVLRQVAVVLQGMVGPEEVLAYLGDGVFGVILLEYDVARADWQLKQWKKEIEAYDFSSGGEVVSLRVTVGAEAYGHVNEAANYSEEAISEMV
jgi:GGDEF domain-containing protein/capsular polysaccharide biosynthesis protein